MYENSSDIHLIEATKQGDSKAFDSLMLKYQSRISKVVSKFVSDPTEALDVSQEIFIKTYLGINKFRAESTFYTWLYRIAINTSKNHLVSQGRRFSSLGLENSDREKLGSKDNMKESGTPEHVMIRDEMENVLHNAIDKLPETLRTVIKLREVDGLSYEAISTVMRCPVGTVRSRIYRARVVIDRCVKGLL